MLTGSSMGSSMEVANVISDSSIMMLFCQTTMPTEVQYQGRMSWSGTDSRMHLWRSKALLVFPVWGVAKAYETHKREAKLRQDKVSCIQGYASRP